MAEHRDRSPEVVPEVPEVDPDVVVAGAGPVGLSAALRLGRAGVRVRVLERRRSPSAHPRAHVVNARTMELLRSWGLADAIRAASLPPHLARAFGWLTRMDAEEFACLDHVAEDVAERCSPERFASCAQDLVEARLRAAVATTPGVAVEFGAEVVGYREVDGGAELDVRTADGVRRDRARYVLACDGAASPLRALAGVGMHLSAPLGRKVNIYFSADLGAQTRGRPFILWFVHHVATQGIFIMLADDRWVYSVDLRPGEEPADYDLARCRDLVRTAVGDPALDLEIHDVLPWTLERGVADAFRRGPLFFVGDAAHRFPPTGGFGMNSGIQDADNLGWKLAAVLAGTAGDGLLDTYEAERKPVAEYNATQSMRNAGRQQEAARRMAAPEVLAMLASPDGDAVRAGVAAGIAELREEFHSLGQQFGHVYSGPGVVDDGSPRRDSTVTEYRVTARPGARAPHARLRSASRTGVSTIELVTGRWTVLVAGDARDWPPAADEAGAATGIEVATCAIQDVAAGATPTDGGFADQHRPGHWRALYELRPGGAVLVRPDGHVAARWSARPADPADALRRALRAILTGAASPAAHDPRTLDRPHQEEP